jgi:rhodanese-related sulfurtransferase
MLRAPGAAPIADPRQPPVELAPELHELLGDRGDTGHAPIIGRPRGVTSGVDGDTAAMRSLDPDEAYRRAQAGQVRILDLRTSLERRRYGAPPGAVPVSLPRHVARPEGEGAVYLCQHAMRSKLTLRNGAAEVAGGFRAWRKAGLPVEPVE